MFKKGRIPNKIQVPLGARLRLVSNNNLPLDTMKKAVEIGKIARRLGIKRNPELCRIVPYVYSDERGKIREDIQFRYKESAKEMILKYLEKRGKQARL